MLRTVQRDTNRVLPYWNEIKKWNQDEKLKLIALISSSLVSDEAIEENEESVLSEGLDPELMQGLAEYAIKEHRAGRCMSQEQVENTIMEAMGWK